MNNNKSHLFDTLARGEYRDSQIYAALLARESDPVFRDTLKKMLTHEKKHFALWREFASQKEFSVSPLTLRLYLFMRRVLGLTFTLRFLEHAEHNGIELYKEARSHIDGEFRPLFNEIIEDETRHEKELIKEIKEEKVEFISSIILGLNDGLIELTGALVGFSFAFSGPRTVALTGLITGIAASLSMASSAYMQARHEQGKDAKKSALYTGISYITVVILLIVPFFLFAATLSALIVMFAIALVIIFSISYYTAIIFERPFKKQFSEILLFSLGVSLISFLIGSLFQSFLKTP